MKVSDLMTTAVSSCRPTDNLQRAAQIMWEKDCGIVPVIDDDARVVGVITDRDICMGAYTQGRPLCEIPVSASMAKQVHGVREDDPLEAAEAVMRRAQVHRLPVHDGDGRLRGVLSMHDLTRHPSRSGGRATNGLSDKSIVETLSAISEPRAATSTKEAEAERSDSVSA